MSSILTHGSDLIGPTHDVQDLSFFLFILVKVFHGFHRNTFEYFSAYNLPLSLKLASITLSCFLYLQYKFRFKTVSFVVAEISSSQTYQLFFPYILQDKYHKTPILFLVILFSKCNLIWEKPASTHTTAIHTFHLYTLTNYSARYWC